MVLCLSILVYGLYSPFSGSSPVFDDANFLATLFETRHTSSFRDIAPRWLAYTSIEFTVLLFGTSIDLVRLGNISLHLATCFALWAVTHSALARFATMPGSTSTLLVGSTGALTRRQLIIWIATVLFALQPAAVYAVGYLVQRSIIMATLFVLLMVWAVLKGLASNHPQRWYLASALFFLFACLSKEHAVTAILLPPLLLVLAWRSEGQGVSPGCARSWRLYILPSLIYLTVVVWVTLSKLGIIAAPYEPVAQDMLGDMGIPAGMAWPLSVLTQTTLFFKYLYIWLIPNVTEMAIDIREPFSMSFLSWPFSIGPFAFLVYGGLAALLLWQGGRKGLIGFALLAPWCLFLVELSTVRIQEPFVLYRSYLWAPWLFLVVPLALERMRVRMLAVLAAVVVGALFFFSYDRLTTFAQPLFLWDESARLAERKGAKTGLERIYHNRGLAYHDMGMWDRAMTDYNRVLMINPGYVWTYSNRGAVFYDMGKYEEALADFEYALARINRGKHYMGRAICREKLGDVTGAVDDFREACKLNFNNACKRLTNPKRGNRGQ